MSNIFRAFSTVSNITDNTQIPVVDPSSGQTKTANFEQIKSYIGVFGSTGATGVTGATGPAGTNGTNGVNGSTGSTGATGYTGATGAFGRPGATGATGPAGRDGTGVNIVGSVLTAGALAVPYTGSIGDGYIAEDTKHLWFWNGVAWADVGNITGPAGATGAAGATGFDGAPGAQGATGFGATGATGPNGFLGATGATGEGSTGATGPMGPIGTTTPATTTTLGGLIVGHNLSITSEGTLSSILSVTGDIPPADAVEGDQWWDSFYGRGYVRYSGQWVEMSPQVLPGVATTASLGLVQIGSGIEVTNGIISVQGGFGATGATGPAGDIGATGATGVQGDVGATGAQGNDGATGAAGEVGATGAQGLDGATGPIGDVGATGAAGTQGETGATGAQGLAGSTWLTGSGLAPAPGTNPGDQYLDNDTGNVYQWDGETWIFTGNIKGPAGTNGATGANGLDGATGTNGLDGATGAQGATGVAGVDGATGSTGPTGATGLQGRVGATGASGIDGATGPTGPTGATGPAGTEASVTAGATAPVTPTLGKLWYDSVTGRTYIYFDDSWVDANPSITGQTGATGAVGATGAQGATGETGLGFSIAKTYVSVAALTADTAPTGIVAGEFAIIETGSVEDPENSRLYLWNGSAYSYTTDLSGAVGITGADGATGAQGATGPAGATGATPTFSAVAEHILPSANLTYDLGSTSSQWRSLYVGTSTIYIGGVPLSVVGGDLQVNGTKLVKTGGSQTSFSAVRSLSNTVTLAGIPFDANSDYITGSSATRNGTSILIVGRPASTKIADLLLLNAGDTLTMNGVTVTLATPFSADVGAYTTYTATSVESVGFTLLEGDIVFNVVTGSSVVTPIQITEAGIRFEDGSVQSTAFLGSSAGATGATGITGATGPAGATGPTGATGPGLDISGGITVPGASGATLTTSPNNWALDIMGWSRIANSPGTFVWDQPNKIYLAINTGNSDGVALKNTFFGLTAGTVFDFTFTHQTGAGSYLEHTFSDITFSSAVDNGGGNIVITVEENLYTLLQAYYDSGAASPTPDAIYTALFQGNQPIGITVAGAPDKVWGFGSGLTFPDNTVQTTAYTGGGSAGATGPAGADGSTGATGLTGATGANGSNGATGLTGATGAFGATGATGLRGATGAVGATGSQGATGYTGATGAGIDATSLTGTSDVVNVKYYASGQVAHDFSTGAVFYHVGPTGVVDPDFTNVPYQNDRTTSVVLIIEQGSTAYVPSQAYVNSDGKMINWLGGTTPTGNANKKDVFSFTLMNIGGTWTVLGSMGSYG